MHEMPFYDWMSRFSNRWKQPPSAIDNYYTPDGVHSTSTGYAADAAALTTDPIALTGVAA